jgi:hypothetical protein
MTGLRLLFRRDGGPFNRVPGAFMAPPFLGIRGFYIIGVRLYFG